VLRPRRYQPFPLSGVDSSLLKKQRGEKKKEEELSEQSRSDHRELPRCNNCRGAKGCFFFANRVFNYQRAKEGKREKEKKRGKMEVFLPPECCPTLKFTKGGNTIGKSAACLSNSKREKREEREKAMTFV